MGKIAVLFGVLYMVVYTSCEIPCPPWTTDCGKTLGCLPLKSNCNAPTAEISPPLPECPPFFLNCHVPATEKPKATPRRGFRRFRRKPKTTRKPRSTTPLAHVSVFSRSINKFAFDFMKSLTKDNINDNIIYSPTSISNVLFRLYTGAMMNTKKEMGKTFHWAGIEEEKLLKEIEKQKLFILSDQKSMKTANQVWTDKSFKVLKSFLFILKKYFHQDVSKSDFQNKPEESRSDINEWVKNKTDGTIEELFPYGSIDQSTKLVLVNAISFTGSWQQPFKRKHTRKYNFYMEDGSKRKVDFMSQFGKFVWGKTRSYKFVEIPYQGAFSMVVIVPRGSAKVNEILAQIENENFARLVDSFRAEKNEYRPIDLILPKFKIKQKINLKNRLQQLGVRDLFTPGKADLSGINGGYDLFCSSAHHQSFIDVNEEGTKAGAATGVATSSFSIPPSVTADRPFLFFIIHKKDRSISFAGRVMNPTY